MYENITSSKIELQNIIERFIKKGSEGSNWDFKQKWHSNNADLLKDIICMANNTTDDMQDGYIIFGVEDKTFEVTGISDDVNRKNQENIVGFLSSQTWSGEEIPHIELKTIEINNKEIDILIIYNEEMTPYYLLKEYSKSKSGKNKIVIQPGVIYSRVGDRNTSSAECATKQATEFLWKKRFGLIGNDEYKLAKRLKNIDDWYSTDEYETIYNSAYGDVEIRRDDTYKLNISINEGNPDTRTWMMDFPYLFSNLLNWNIGEEEIGRRRRWHIYLNGRKLDISLFGVQSTRQTFYHIEPQIYWDLELDMPLDSLVNSVKYYAYIQNSINFLAFNMFFDKQCYKDQKTAYEKALLVIPVFKSENERVEFIQYVRNSTDEFKKAIKNQSIEELFPTYAKNMESVIFYKLGKTLVEWLKKWRDN